MGFVNLDVIVRTVSRAEKTVAMMNVASNANGIRAESKRWKIVALCTLSSVSVSCSTPAEECKSGAASFSASREEEEHAGFRIPSLLKVSYEWNPVSECSERK